MSLSVVLIFGIVVGASVGLVATVRRLDPSRRPGFLREIALIVTLFFVYRALRGLTEGGASEAIANSHNIATFERSLGIFVEPPMQQAIVQHQWLVDLANLIYVWGYWPSIAVTAIWLYTTRESVHHRVRRAIFLSAAIGVVIFALYPVAPPRLANVQLVDTVRQHVHYYRGFQPEFLTNQYAAIPSFHVGWLSLVGLALVQESTRLAIRALGLILPLLMTWVVIVTGNHYLTDAVIGVAISLAALPLAALLPRFTRGTAEPIREQT